jgi:hypothetical protein
MAERELLKIWIAENGEWSVKVGNGSGEELIKLLGYLETAKNQVIGMIKTAGNLNFKE